MQTFKEGEPQILTTKRCQFCGEDHEVWYDYKTKMGPWAYGCESCYSKTRMFLKLGTGMGQKYVKGQKVEG